MSTVYVKIIPIIVKILRSVLEEIFEPKKDEDRKNTNLNKNWETAVCLHKKQVLKENIKKYYFF